MSAIANDSTSHTPVAAGPPVARPPVTLAAPLSARVPVAALAFAVLAAACADPATRQVEPIPADVLAADHEEWRANRRASLANPETGAVSWIGLWELAEGANPFGADPALAIALPPEDSPPLAGTLFLETVPAERGDGDAPGGEAPGPEASRRMRLVPADGGGIELRDGGPVEEPIVVEHDRSGNTTYLTLGTLGLRVHAERGTDRLWLRAWDRDSPRAAAFELPPYYPVRNEWRFAARFDPYPEPRMVPLADVTGGTVANVSPGELVFAAEGREHRLIAFATERSRDYFVTLWDSTATVDTYQGGRYMRVPFPDEDGWTVIDFNRAYNPPCVFTAYSVCSLPPRENRLALAVAAGEKRPEGTR